MGAADTAMEAKEQNPEPNEAAEGGVEPKRGDEKEVVVGVDTSQRETTQPSQSRLQTHYPVPPIQVVPHSASPPTAAPSQSSVTPPQPSLASLNARGYTNRITLLLFLLHLVAVSAGICFLVYRAIVGALDVGTPRARRERRVLRHWLPPIEAATLVGVVLAFAWQRAVRWWPRFMVRFILWTSFAVTMAAGVLLLCLSMPATNGLGVVLVAFSIGTSLYACWTSRRASFTAAVFERSLRPAAKFPDLEGPAYLMLFGGFLYVSVWCLAVIGALNFDYPPLTVMALVLSLAWTAEVMRNVANLTVSRVVALYYLRGMQCSTQFSFQRALSQNLGSACLGSLFVPTIEALRILARGLNLLEGEDEFMFSCAHCCLHVMDSVFRYGNSWAFVHIAAYGRGFVAASKSTWGLFERVQDMDKVVDSDITSSLCFLTGVSSGAVCAIVASAWTFVEHRPYTATVSLLAFWVGYLMTRIGMALPQACVGCYYVCYAENPSSRFYDLTIPDRLADFRSDREKAVSTPRFPRRFAAA